MTGIRTKKALSPEARRKSWRAPGAQFRLCPHLRMRKIGLRFVFLDLAASRYFLLEDQAAERFASFVDGVAEAHTLDWLCERRIIEAGAPLLSVNVPIPPRRSVVDRPLGRPAAWMVAEALAAQLAMRRRVRHIPLADLLRPVAATKTDPNASRPVVAACRVAARYRSATDQCLPNALAMRRMLARRDIAAELVIGVMLPFAAHCWLQSGDVVLSDPFGTVQNFHPLVVA